MGLLFLGLALGSMWDALNGLVIFWVGCGFDVGCPKLGLSFFGLA